MAVQNMVNVLWYLIATLIFGHDFTFSYRNKLIAVTYFEGIESYYKNIFETLEFRRNREYPRPLEKSDAKSLCKNILKSGYFCARHEYWVDVKNGTEVLDNYQNAMRKFENRYRQLKVFVGGEEKTEFLLTCFAKLWASKRLKMYHISSEYDVNADERRYSRSPIAGRFIFEYDNENKIILRALAEEPTLSKMPDTSLDKREQEYIAHKKPLSEVGNPLTRNNVEDDPVCQLSPEEKLRLCTTVLSSSQYRKRVKFVPIILNVQVDCAPVQVSFRNLKWQKIDHKNILFEEQVIGCKTLNYDKYDRPIIYYISRGYDVNQVLVYKYRDGKVLVKDWMTRAANVVKY